MHRNNFLEIFESNSFFQSSTKIYAVRSLFVEDFIEADQTNDILSECSGRTRDHCFHGYLLKMFQFVYENQIKVTNHVAVAVFDFCSYNLLGSKIIKM